MLAPGRNRPPRLRHGSMPNLFGLAFCALMVVVFAQSKSIGDTDNERFLEQIEPILAESCYECHGYGTAEGSVTLDRFESIEQARSEPKFWWRALRMLQAGLMPPPDSGSMESEQRQQLLDWIKNDVFLFHPNQPDPGRVTLRRLNRIEYRNTIRDLLGVDYDTMNNFPPDDSGHGFDNLGDVLSMSTLHLEKYIKAAETISQRAVPKPSQAKAHRQFFGGEVPASAEEKREFTAKFLSSFATRAYRRPVDDETIDRLANLTLATHIEDDESFEEAISQSITAVLSSPRFLFLVEQSEAPDHEPHSLVDEYSLASRLSYFLWSTMPDEELFRLARENTLRENLPQQIDRMIADPRWGQFVSQFAGQWLHSRDVEHFTVQVPDILRRDDPPNPKLAKLLKRLLTLRMIPSRDRTKQQRRELKNVSKKYHKATAKYRDIDHAKYRALKSFMRQETELHFEHVFHEDRPLLELLDCNYAYLNQSLAEHYGIEGVQGAEFRKVELPADSPRGGVLTQGTMLVTTSNPNRTSPVKRGLYILENILGVPPAPPPPNIPALPDVPFPADENVPTLREALAKHREDPLCSSCHNRMDPLGLALENFNALGAWREAERGKPIDPSGTLITGSTFNGIRQLKQILATQHQRDFYRCVTEKLLTFAIGRGLEYYDVQTVDAIIHQLESEGGKSSVLLRGIIASAPFQQRRNELTSDAQAASEPFSPSPSARQYADNPNTTVRQ